MGCDRRPFHSRHGPHGLGRNGEPFGWGREGRVRLDDTPMLHRRRGSMGGLADGLDRLSLGGGGGRGGGLLGGLRMRDRLSQGSGTSFFGRDDGFLDMRRSPHNQSRLGLERGGNPRDRLLEGGGPYMLSGLGSGSRSSLGSLGSGSQYSLRHFDRRPRQYHYQPPYVEDDLEAELIEEEMMRRRHEALMDMRHGRDRDDYIGPVYDDDFIDPRRRGPML